MERTAKSWFYTFRYDTGTYYHQGQPLTEKQLLALIKREHGRKPNAAWPDPFEKNETKAQP